MKCVVVAFVGVVLCQHLQPAQAVVVTSGPSAPSTNLLVGHAAVGTSFAETWQWIGNTGNDHRDIGQSFLMPAVAGTDLVSLDAITVRVRDMGSSVPGSSYTLELWTVTDAFDDSGNTLLNSQVGALPVSGLSGNSYWTFDIDNVVLDTSANYAFMLAFNTGPDANRSVTLVEDFSSGYSNGRWLARNGTLTNWSAITNDAEFYIQGSPIFVPEPGSLSLLGWFALVLILRKPPHRRVSLT